ALRGLPFPGAAVCRSKHLAPRIIATSRFEFRLLKFQPRGILRRTGESSLAKVWAEPHNWCCYKLLSHKILNYEFLNHEVPKQPGARIHAAQECCLSLFRQGRRGGGPVLRRHVS